MIVASYSKGDTNENYIQQVLSLFNLCVLGCRPIIYIF